MLSITLCGNSKSMLTILLRNCSNVVASMMLLDRKGRLLQKPGPFVPDGDRLRAPFRYYSDNTLKASGEQAKRLMSPTTPATYSARRLVAVCQMPDSSWQFSFFGMGNIQADTATER